jgi:hypothetical protein
MFIQQTNPKLLSLLLVYLTENYGSSYGGCCICGQSYPRFGKVYQINGKMICIDCIVQRIEGHGQD